MHSKCPVSFKTFPPPQAEILAKAQSSRRPGADRPEHGEKLWVNILKGVQWRAPCHFAVLAGETMGPLSWLAQPRWAPAASDDSESGEVRIPPGGEQEGHSRPCWRLLTRSKLKSAARAGSFWSDDVKLACQSLDDLTLTSTKIWSWEILYLTTLTFDPLNLKFPFFIKAYLLLCNEIIVLSLSITKDNSCKSQLVARRERLDHILGGYRTHFIISGS